MAWTRQGYRVTKEVAVIIDTDAVDYFIHSTTDKIGAVKKLRNAFLFQGGEMMSLKDAKEIIEERWRKANP